LRQSRLEAVEHQAGQHPCPACGSLTRASFPHTVKAPAQYGQSVLAVALYFHLYQLLPLARAAETMRDLFGCRLSPATIQEAARDLAQALLPTEARLKAALAEAPVLGVDETGLHVNNALRYVHVARTDDLTH
jgi:transposase